MSWRISHWAACASSVALLDDRAVAIGDIESFEKILWALVDVLLGAW